MNADNFYSIAHSLWVNFGPTPAGIISDLWILFLLYWLVSALNRKKTKRRESIVQRMLYILPLLAAFYLLYRYNFGYGWLGTRFVPDTPLVQWLAVLITAAGVAASLQYLYRDGSGVPFSAGIPAELDRHDRRRFGRGLRGHLFEPEPAPLATQVRAPVRAACTTVVDGDSSH
jgi:hypothetical protein